MLYKKVIRNIKTMEATDFDIDTISFSDKYNDEDNKSYEIMIDLPLEKYVYKDDMANSDIITAEIRVYYRNKHIIKKLINESNVGNVTYINSDGRMTLSSIRGQNHEIAFQADYDLLYGVYFNVTKSRNENELIEFEDRYISISDYFRGDNNSYYRQTNTIRDMTEVTDRMMEEYFKFYNLMAEMNKPFLNERPMISKYLSIASKISNDNIVRLIER